MGILLSRDRHSLEHFDVVPDRDTGPNSRNTSLLPLLSPPEDDEPTGVLGTLKEMPVGEIVQTLAQGFKDALIEVKPKGEPVGVIGLERGRVVYAKTDLLEGEAAFQQLFCAHRGAFRIRYGRRPEARNIDRDPTWLILDAARLMDERRNEQPVFDTPPQGTPRPPFSGFFDEAGVKTPPPIQLPPQAKRFQSLAIAEQLDDVDDIDRSDTDRTTRQRMPRDAHS